MTCLTCKKRNTYSCPYRNVINQLSCARYYEKDETIFSEISAMAVDLFADSRELLYGDDWLVKLLLTSLL